MAKAKKTVFFCQECGYESPKWMGQCPGCKSWNTFVEETVSPNQTKHQEATGRNPYRYQRTGSGSWRRDRARLDDAGRW